MLEQMIIATVFTTPIDTGPGFWPLLWLLPLLLAVVVAYKATKMESIELAGFAKECALLFLSLVFFIALVGFGLIVFIWLVMT